MATTAGTLRSTLSDLIKELDLKETDAEELLERILELTERYRPRLAEKKIPPLDQHSTYLITYGDSIHQKGQNPLATLTRFLKEQVRDAITDVHLLPMFPWTSDDGFAVVDYRKIDSNLGTWNDVFKMGQQYSLMFDFVANHVSSSSQWIIGWLGNDETYKDYFLSPDNSFDTSKVVRPRTSPLMHDYEKPDGTKVRAWTTFGPDQVDVNAANPAVLEELTDVLLSYVERDASTIRLDAIGYLWKQSGTTCLHLPGTHAVIKIWRAILDEIAPGVRILTETNVPHADNVTYFGDGTNEAHMVYQFALPPLVLHSFVAGDSTELSKWATSLEDLGQNATWFNFLASHDGIGMRPAAGLLTIAQQQALTDRVVAHGGRVSYATEEDGTRSVYELNTNYITALTSPQRAHDAEHVVGRALAAHAILFSVIGVPAVYYHSLLGSEQDILGMKETNISRRINRERLDAETLRNELSSSPRRKGIFEGLLHLLQTRSKLPAFSPFSPQEILDLGPTVFAVRRGSGAEAVTAIINVSGQEVHLPGIKGFDVLSQLEVDGLHLPEDGIAWIVDNPEQVTQ